MGADALAGGSQLSRNPSMPPGNLLIERENPYKRYQPVEVLLPTRLPSWIIGPVYSDEEFGECDRRDRHPFAAEPVPQLDDGDPSTLQIDRDARVDQVGQSTILTGP